MSEADIREYIEHYKKAVANDPSCFDERTEDIIWQREREAILKRMDPSKDIFLEHKKQSILKLLDEIEEARTSLDDIHVSSGRQDPWLTASTNSKKVPPKKKPKNRRGHRVKKQSY